MSRGSARSHCMGALSWGLPSPPPSQMVHVFFASLFILAGALKGEPLLGIAFASTVSNGAHIFCFTVYTDVCTPWECCVVKNCLRLHGLTVCRVQGLKWYLTPLLLLRPSRSSKYVHCFVLQSLLNSALPGIVPKLHCMGPLWWGSLSPPPSQTVHATWFDESGELNDIRYAFASALVFTFCCRLALPRPLTVCKASIGDCLRLHRLKWCTLPLFLPICVFESSTNPGS